MVLRTRLFLASLAALLACGATAHAQAPAAQPKAVIELFTSQGCSSCPPADALFVEFAKNPDVIGLTLPVTYWDYLGWKDTLGQDVFTKRQKYYAKARGDGQVYTPQAVINGASHIICSDKAEIDRTMRQLAGNALPAKVSLQEEAGTLKIKLVPTDGAGDRTAGVWVLPITRTVTVPIARGENQGRTVSYTNVVRALVRVADWDGKETTVTAPLSATQASDADTYVVIVQTDQPGRYGLLPGAILGAARATR